MKFDLLVVSVETGEITMVSPRLSKKAAKIVWSRWEKRLGPETAVVPILWPRNRISPSSFCTKLSIQQQS